MRSMDAVSSSYRCRLCENSQMLVAAPGLVGADTFANITVGLENLLS